MKTKTCDAIIVHAKPFFEKDKLIECISPTHGKIRCLAKSAQSNKSKLNGVLQPLHYVSLHLFQGRSFTTITQCDAIQTFTSLRTQFKPLQTALYFTNIIRNSIQEHQINEELFTLLLTSLNYLNNQEDELWITQYFYKKFLTIEGIAHITNKHISDEQFLIEFKKYTGKNIQTPLQAIK